MREVQIKAIEIRVRAEVQREALERQLAELKAAEQEMRLRFKELAPDT